MPLQILNIARNARSYLGTSFCHQGRSREEGVDCIGFLLCSLKDSDWSPLSPETTEMLAYSRFPDGVQLLQYLKLEADEVLWGGMQEGDIALMAYARDPQHVGLIVNRAGGGFNLIHSVNGKGVVEHIFDDIWKKRVIGIFRIKEVL